MYNVVSEHEFLAALYNQMARDNFKYVLSDNAIMQEVTDTYMVLIDNIINNFNHHHMSDIMLRKQYMDYTAKNGDAHYVPYMLSVEYNRDEYHARTEQIYLFTGEFEISRCGYPDWEKNTVENVSINALENYMMEGIEND